MSESVWRERLAQWRGAAGVRVRPRAGEVRDAMAALNVPHELSSFYEVCNGLLCGRFDFLPVREPARLKETWKSLERANGPGTSPYFGASESLLQRFVVFADIGGGACAAMDRSDGSIWYEEDGKLHQTDLDLAEFVDLSIREALEG